MNIPITLQNIKLDYDNDRDDDSYC